LAQFNDPKYWRNRAKEAHAIADQLTDPEAKCLMFKFKIATDCDQLGNRAYERMAKPQPQ
jgi:hypothetical protein